MLLGNHHDPVRIAVQIADDDDDANDLGDRLIASRSIMSLLARQAQRMTAPE